MKSIFFIANDLIRTDVSTALMERLYKLNPQEYDISLFLYSHKGEYISKLPVWVNISDSIPENTNEAALFCSFSNFRLAEYIARGAKTARKILYLFFDELEYEHNNSFLSDEFRRLEVFESYENIFTQTRSVKAALLHLCPSLGGRVFTLPDDIWQARIERLSRRPDPYHFDGIRILMTGSASLDGNQITALRAAFILKQRGFYFRLYLLDGGFKAHSCARIMGLKDTVCFLNSPENPYPYIANCDVFISTEHPLERQKLLSALLSSVGLDRSSAKLCPKDTDPHLEAAIALCRPIVAINTPLLHRRLEWDEDSLLIEDDPAVLADAVEYITSPA